jgi:hypothetical protein
VLDDPQAWLPSYEILWKNQQESRTATLDWLTYIGENQQNILQVGGPSSIGAEKCQAMLQASNKVVSGFQEWRKKFPQKVTEAKSPRFALCLQATNVQVAAISYIWSLQSGVVKYSQAEISQGNAELGKFNDLLKFATDSLNSASSMIMDSGIYLGFQEDVNMSHAGGWHLANKLQTQANELTQSALALMPEVSAYWGWLKGECDLPSN